MFFIARFKSASGDATVTDVSPVSAPWGWSFDKPLDEPMPDVTIRVTRLNGLLDFWRAGTYLCVSQRLVHLLKDMNDNNYDNYNLQIYDESGNADGESFRVFRFRNRFACMDMEKSEFHLNEDGGVHEIRRLTLRENEIPPGRHFFELAERTTVYIASAEFASEWQKRGLRGRDFIPIQELNYWI